jgi:transposase
VAPEHLKEIYDRGFEAVFALVQALAETIAQLERQNEILKAQTASLSKDSSNSNKPPSSDGFGKKRGAPKRGSSGRKPGPERA